MKKIDYKKELKTLYSAKSDSVLVKVPKMNFLMVDGQGDPNTSKEYVNAIEALYSVAYTIKFMIKKGKATSAGLAQGAIDYGVMPLEGLWWADDMKTFGQTNDKSDWIWTAMIMQPKIVTKKHFADAIKQVKEKKDLISIDKIRFEAFNEGQAGQLLHVGPYSDEGPNIKRLHEFIKEQGGKFDGKKQKHHEIYLGDPRRTAPAKLKTIIRQPFVK